MRGASGPVVILFVVGLLGGCIGDGADDVASGAGDGATLALFASADPLWSGPQDFPHPAYGFPTLTNPATGGPMPPWWTPIAAIDHPAPIAGLEFVAGTGEEFSEGRGMAVFGSLAVVPAAEQTFVVDISEPTAPRLLSTVDVGGRGAAFIPYPDGRLVFAMALNGRDIAFYDITDPLVPEFASSVTPTSGTHKIAVVPGTPILYNANSLGGGPPPGSFSGDSGTGITEIYDLSDPAEPVLVQEWANGYGCHHIYFHLQPAEDYLRALCAGIEVTQIWDIADPLAPEVLVEIPVPHGVPGTPPAGVAPATFSHAAILNTDHTVLVVGDETGGGVAPGCDPRVDAGVGPAADGPLGNLWFYDVSDESSPRLLSWLSPGPPVVENPPSTVPAVDPTDPVGTVFRTIFGSGINCTSHHGRIVPDPERDLLAFGFYGAGVVLVDFTDPADPFIVDQWSDGTQTWEVWYYNGYLFTGDLARGLDVLRFV